MTDPAITIRPAMSSDAELLADLGTRTFIATYTPYLPADSLAATAALWFHPDKQAAEIADPNVWSFIVSVNELPVGYATLRTGAVPESVTGSQPVELARLYLLSEWIGRKIGAMLMSTCLDDARQRDHDTIWLGVWERNPRAIAFYEKWGFVRVGVHAFPFEGEQQTDIVMQRTV